MDNQQMSNTTIINFEEEEDDEDEGEGEEAVSLCDFALNSDEAGGRAVTGCDCEATDLFEFSNERISDMSHAEDIISCGKLMPYKQQHQNDSSSSSSSSSINNININHSRRYCDSLPDLNPSNSIQLIRSSRSLDSKKILGRNSSEASDIHRSLSKGSLKSDSVSLRGSKPPPPPRWYALMFGVVKLPPEMDLRDIRNRQQVRRSMVEAGRGGSRRRCWGQDLLRVLSCKDHQSVAAVSASVRPVPPN